jgi:cyclase
MAIASEPVEIAAGVWHFQTRTWRTNALMIVRDDATLLFDPCWTPEEIRRMRDAAERAATPEQHLLLSHADCDHVCGVPFFPEATVVADRRSAALVADGSAAAQLASAASVWGLDLPTDLRVDRALEPGEALSIGGVRLATVDAAGHSPDGLAYALADERLLFAGDYLSASMCPLVWWSVAESARATERLLAAIDEHGVEWVVPGHGPLLTAEEAIAVGRADVAYFHALERAAAEAGSQGLSYAEAVCASIAVEPPRASEADMEFLAPRLLNATRALSAVGIEPPATNPQPWDYLTGSAWSAPAERG